MARTNSLAWQQFKSLDWEGLAETIAEAQFRHRRNKKIGLYKRLGTTKPVYDSWMNLIGMKERVQFLLEGKERIMQATCQADDGSKVGTRG